MCFQICPHVNSGEWTKKYDDVGKCPYAHYDDQWIGYEDEDSIGIKVRIATSSLKLKLILLNDTKVLRNTTILPKNDFASNEP